MIVQGYPLATIFIGSVRNGRTRYAITHGGAWFSRCDEAGRATYPVKFNASTVHLPETSHHVINAGLTAHEQAQLVALQEYLEYYSGENGFSIDCYFGLLYLCIEKPLDVPAFEQVCKVIGVAPNLVLDMANQEVSDGVVEALRTRSLMSEDGARSLLEDLGL